jgi:hypothetical protein
MPPRYDGTSGPLPAHKQGWKKSLPLANAARLALAQKVGFSALAGQWTTAASTAFGADNALNHNPFVTAEERG